jgi:hypothetical protein
VAAICRAKGKPGGTRGLTGMGAPIVGQRFGPHNWPAPKRWPALGVVGRIEKMLIALTTEKTRLSAELLPPANRNNLCLRGVKVNIATLAARIAHNIFIFFRKGADMP